MCYDQKTTGVRYVCVWATDGKDGGRETEGQICIGDDDSNGRVGNTAMYSRILQCSYWINRASRIGTFRQLWMGDKESRVPMFGGAYGKKWLILRRVILPETEEP